jgi:hypothetical protein
LAASLISYSATIVTQRCEWRENENQLCSEDNNQAGRSWKKGYGGTSIQL